MIGNSLSYLNFSLINLLLFFSGLFYSNRFLHTAFLSLDRDILEQQRRQQDDPAAGSSAIGGDESGCTGVVVLTTPTCYVCANVGDSRACVLTPRGPARALSSRGQI